MKDICEHCEEHGGPTRREALSRAGSGFGLIALAGLLDKLGALEGTARASSAPNPMLPRRPHFAARAKAVIWLYAYGGPSSMDLFDFKPELDRMDGKTYAGKEKIQLFTGSGGPLMRSPFKFARHGESGAWVSEVLPGIARHVDDIAFIRSCQVDTNTHDLALFQTNTGLPRLGFPSVGSWVTYGLGSECQDLPGFVVMYDKRGAPVSGPGLWSSSFLPGAFQGTVFRPGPQTISNLQPAAGVDRSAQREQLNLMGRINEKHRRRHPGEADLDARIASFELAYRMQMSAPEAVDVGRENEATRTLYGMDRDVSRPFGTQLLMARRLVERGVRFIQVYSGGIQSDWDAHSKLGDEHRLRCAETDMPIAGLLTDLKQRGLLDSTLIVWGGEFGRLPMSQGSSGGRDHNPHGFLYWMAGGGIRGGASHGETDELGYKAVVNPVSPHDLHATILHLLGMDHEKLTYEHNGRRFRLTDVAGSAIRPIVA